MSGESIIQREILSVSQLTGRLQDVIEIEFGLIWVSGEISNLRRPSSGHLYLTLKDENAQIKAVMFRNKQRYLALEPADGQEVMAHGRLSVYAPRGEYQLVIEYLEPRGEGALRLAFERLKEKLAAEGLFDQERKKKLPFLPGRTALVTSPTGAAVRDFIRIARRRFDNAHLSVYPVRVQGEGAAAEIAAAVADLNSLGGFDLIVLMRGGGSLEDLWPFNEEAVVRAVAASKIPVVSAVGHEIDYTLADLAADLRAPTPSAAAELVFREKAELKAYLEGSARRLGAGVRGRLGLGREKLSHARTRLGDPRRRLADYRLRLDDLSDDLQTEVKDLISALRLALIRAEARLAPVSPKTRLSANRAELAVMTRDLFRAGRDLEAVPRDRLARLAARLGDLSPLAVLQRGYALARRRPEMTALRSSQGLEKGDRINLTLARGELDVIVDEVIK